MDYIKDNIKKYVFDTKLSQEFKNKPTTLVDEKNIIKLRSEKHISDLDMLITQFLFKYRFATEDMLFQLIQPTSKSLEDFRKDLSKLIKHRIINACALIDKSDCGPGIRLEIPYDALLIYCLDIGGRVLVNHFHNADTTGWYTTENMRGAEKIEKDLVTNSFYLSLLKDCKFVENEDNYFKLNPGLTLGKTKVVPSFEMRIMVKDDFRYYVGDVVRRFEFPMEFREHLSKLDSIMVTNAWKKYFYNIEKAPTIFFICEDDVHALEVAKMIVGISSFDITTGFRLTTDERIKKGLGSKGAFLAYDSDKDVLIEKTIGSFKI